MVNTTRRRVAVVTDSTSDLPRDLVEKYGIHMVPQILIMGDNTWRDGVDIDPPTFYRLLKTSPHFPSTSQVSIATFQELFETLSQEADGIVAVLISNELSGTLNSALAAAASLPDDPIEIVDSRSASMQLGFIALAAARAAAAGADLKAVANVARSLADKVRVYFVVDTLEFLHRGGRIGAAARLFGSALNLKPVLEVRDGIVTPVAKIRTRRKALDKVLDIVEEQIAPWTVRSNLEGGRSEGSQGRQAPRVHMAVLHIASPEEAAQVVEQLVARFHPVEMIASECGPVVGAHVGPGTIGVVFYTE